MLFTLLLSCPLWGAPLGQDVAPQEKAPIVRGVEWFQGELKAVRSKAQAEGKGILFVVYTDESSWCTRLFETTLKDAQVIEELKSLICVRVNFSRDAEGRAVDPNAALLTQRFPVRSLPALLYLGKSLNPEDLIEGFIPAANLAIELKRMKSGKLTLSALRAAVEAAPNDIEALWSLSTKVDDFGYVSEYKELTDRIALLDPDGRSRPLRNLALQILEEQLFREYTKSGVYASQRLIAFLEDEPNPSVAHQGWSTLAGLVRNLRGKEADRKKKREFGKLSRKSHQRAWSVVPSALEISYACRALNDFFEDRKVLTSGDRKFTKSLGISLREATKGRSDAPAAEAVYCDALACAAAIGRDPESALRWIQRAIELDPSTPSYGQRLAALRTQN